MEAGRSSLLQDVSVCNSGQESAMKELQAVGHTKAQSCHLFCSSEWTELSGLLFVGWEGRELCRLRLIPLLRVAR